MFSDEVGQEISKIALPIYNAIHRRSVDLFDNIEKNVQKKLKKFPEFTLQVDESCDISGKSRLLEYICFIDGNQVTNQLFCCKKMSLNSRGQDILTF